MTDLPDVIQVPRIKVVELMNDMMHDPDLASGANSFAFRLGLISRADFSRRFDEIWRMKYGEPQQ